MPNPYASKSNEHFWRAAIANLRLHEINPVPAKRFAMADGTRISTASSPASKFIERDRFVVR